MISLLLSLYPGCSRVHWSRQKSKKERSFLPPFRGWWKATTSTWGPSLTVRKLHTRAATPGKYITGYVAAVTCDCLWPLSTKADVEFVHLNLLHLQVKGRHEVNLSFGNGLWLGNKECLYMRMIPLWKIHIVIWSHYLQPCLQITKVALIQGLVVKQNLYFTEYMLHPF